MKSPSYVHHPFRAIKNHNSIEDQHVGPWDQEEQPYTKTNTEWRKICGVKGKGWEGKSLGFF